MDYIFMEIIIPIIMLAITAMTLFVALKSYKSSWDIARRSGVFRSVNLDMGISGVPVQKSIITKLLVGIPIPILDNRQTSNIGIIPLKLRSSGEKTIKNVVLSFQYPKGYKRESLEKLPYVAAGPGDINAFQHSFSSLENRAFATYIIKSIDPGKCITINEPVHLDPTLSHTWIYDKASKSITFSTRFTSSNFLKFDVLLSAEDFPIQELKMELMVAEVNSRHDLANVVLKKLLTSTQDAIRKNSSFSRYLKALIHDQQRDLVHLLIPRDIKKFERTHDVHVFPDRPWVAGAHIKLFEWWRLILK